VRPILHSLRSKLGSSGTSRWIEMVLPSDCCEGEVDGGIAAELGANEILKVFNNVLESLILSVCMCYHAKNESQRATT
jgi:hypothetical protein